MALPLLVAGALKSAYMLPAFLRHGSSPAAPVYVTPLLVLMTLRFMGDLPCFDHVILISIHWPLPCATALSFVYLSAHCHVRYCDEVERVRSSLIAKQALLDQQQAQRVCRPAGQAGRQRQCAAFEFVLIDCDSSRLPALERQYTIHSLPPHMLLPLPAPQPFPARLPHNKHQPNGPPAKPL